MSDHTQLIRSTWVIASLTAISRVLGLAREIVLAYYFATSGALSAFRIAFMLPNLARRLFGEGALSAAMIPVLSETLRDDGEEASRRFVGRLLLTLTGLLIVGVIAAIVVAMVWNSVRPDPALGLATILMPYMAMICLVAVVGGILNVRGHFAAPAAMPIVLNLGILGGAVIGARWYADSDAAHIRVICYGVLVAGVVQLAFSWLSLRAARFKPQFSWNLRDARLRRVAVLMGPMVLGLSAVQLNTLADYAIAYVFITENGERVGPAVLGYAQFLYQLPLGVFGIALATAIFPALARHGAANDDDALSRVLTQGIRLSLFIALPASVGLMFIARPLVTALYVRGDFDIQDSERVASTLVFYSIGMVGYFAQHIIVRTFYALKDSRTPTRVAMCMVAVNLGLNLALVSFMQERGLALSTAVCALVQVVWLTVLIARRVHSIEWRPLLYGLMRMAIATALMYAGLAACSAPGIIDVIRPDHAWIWTAILVAIGVIIYAGASALLRVPELRMLWSRRSERSDGASVA